MSTYDTSKTTFNEAGDPVVKNLRCTFAAGTLVVSEVTLDANQMEVVTPVMVQPWKCFNDGSRGTFADETDAFNWLEEFKDRLF